MESMYLSTVVFVKEGDSFCDVKCYPDCAKVFQCYLSSASKHWEQWRDAGDEVRSWTFLSREYKN